MTVGVVGGALRRRVYRCGEDRILGGMIIYMGRKEIKGQLKSCKVECVHKSNTNTAEEILFTRDLIRK